MKHKGSVSEFNCERDLLIMKYYSELSSTHSHKNIRELCALIAKMPAPRFYVAEKRASVVCSQLRKGQVKSNMLGERRRMYEEILRRVTHLQQSQFGMPLCDAVFEVVNSPAPELYLSFETIYSIIYRMQRLKREKIWKSKQLPA